MFDHIRVKLLTVARWTHIARWYDDVIRSASVLTSAMTVTGDRSGSHMWHQRVAACRTTG
jgi:hypothetical protein